MNTYFVPMSCAKWSSKRMQCPVCKTHAPSLRESFAHALMHRGQMGVIVPAQFSAFSVCTVPAIDSNSIKSSCLSCGTTSTKLPFFYTEIPTACQAVAVGPCYIFNAYPCQLDSPPSVPGFVPATISIRRLSGTPSVGVSSSMLCSLMVSDYRPPPHSPQPFLWIHVSDSATVAKTPSFFIWLWFKLSANAATRSALSLEGRWSSSPVAFGPFLLCFVWLLP